MYCIASLDVSVTFYKLAMLSVQASSGEESKFDMTFDCVDNTGIPLETSLAFPLMKNAELRRKMHVYLGPESPLPPPFD